MTPARPLKGWRTVKELRDELRFPSDDACRAWLRRHQIASVRRGRVILIDGLDVDKALRKVSHLTDFMGRFGLSATSAEVGEQGTRRIARPA